MDQLDYDGMFSSTGAQTWIMSPFDQQDATYLSASRQMLETIVEETSEDEENHQSWSQIENVWSDESDTGSVIRIDLHHEQDSISERDFACPAKRPRRDDLQVVEELPSIRKFSRNENLLLSEIPENGGYRKRFDDLYSDSDSLSYNSLSRSSSLIQFESLERQLQGDLASIGHSSPSLTTADANCQNKMRESCMRRYESTDGRIHQTYYDLAKIEFNNDLIFRAKSDSESSDNSILSHEERVLKPTNAPDDGSNISVAASEQRACFKGKKSAENLSEDSGYGEYIAPLRIKSKSIPNFLQSNDRFCEEDEFEWHKSLEMIYDGGEMGREMRLHSRRTMNTGQQEAAVKRDPKTKIAAKCGGVVTVEAARLDSGWFNGNDKNKFYTNNDSLSSTSSSTQSSSPSRSTASSPSSTTSSSNSSPSSLNISASLPNVHLQLDPLPDNTTDRSSLDFDSNFDRFAIDGSNDSINESDSRKLRAVSSCPDNLYLNDADGDYEKSRSAGKHRHNRRHHGGHHDVASNDDDDDFVWNLNSSKFTRSQNRSSGGQKYFASKLSSSGQNFLNVSYNNLTLLDYSGSRNSFTMSDYGGNSKRNSREFELGKGNFLLDEISSHFDKNLSILSDRECDSDLISEFLRGERIVAADKEPGRREKIEPEPVLRMRKVPPGGAAEKKRHSAGEPERKNSTSLETFDMNPTNLRTTYAESLESCSFEVDELPATNLDHSAAIKRSLVASTPNLSNDRSDDIEDQLHTSSAHTSLQALPGTKPVGILVRSSGSRNSLGKGVSFCPIVSEISFREQSSEEAAEAEEDNYADDDDEESEETINDPEPPSYFASSADRDRSYCHDHRIGSQDVESDDNRVGVQQAQVLVNSEIINKRQAIEQHDHHQSHQHDHHQSHQQLPPYTAVTVSSNSNNSDSGPVSSAAGSYGSNVPTVDECSVDFNCDIPITVEMFASELNNEVIQVPSNSQKNNNGNDSSGGSASYGDERASNVREIVAKINNNNISTVAGNGNHANYPSRKMQNFESNGDGKQQPQIPPPTSSTGTDLLSAKFKPKPDEKRHKNSFLSRFAGGFRFSLRRKKKVALDHNTNDTIPYNNSQMSRPKQPLQVKTSSSSSKQTSDYVYIPLKGPSNASRIDSTANVDTPDSSCVNSIRSPCNVISGASATSTPIGDRHLPFGAGTNQFDKNHVLLAGKPPLPKQPPRVVGVCEKIRAGQPALPLNIQQHQSSSPVINFYNSASNNNHNNNNNGRHAQVFRSKSQPREIDERFLEGERQFYYNQFDETMNGNGCTTFLSSSSATKNGRESLPLPPLSGTSGNGRMVATKSTTLPSTTTNGNKIGLIETNLDTHETVISGKTRSLMELGPQNRHVLTGHLDHHVHPLANTSNNIIDTAATKRPHKSMEFLLDKENQKDALPPENELQKTHDGTVALSEHQLRVQASLQRLNIPDWFRQYNTTPKTDPTGYRLSNFNRKRASESGRWAGLNSKTTSLSSLGSQRSDRSPLLLSPSAHSHGGQTGFSRWSTSHLNSTQTSPSVSTRGSFCRGGVANSSVISGQSACGVTMRSSYRQPYLGWRSQEKLAQPRTPHERLASSVLAQHHQHHHHHQHQKRQQQDEEQQQKQEPPVTPEIQSSIKEVTSAIVHYVNDQTNRTVSRSRSTSPNSRKCWVESSFVGVRPVESPQTPVIDNSFSATTQSGGPGATSSTHSGATDILHMNGVGDTVNEPGRFVSNSPNSLQVDQQSRFRRRSEGDAQRQAQQKLKLENAQQQNILISTTNPSSDVPLQSPRRISLDSSESKTASELLVRCRNTKCEQFASAGDAKKQYKSCHNCTHQYCSRECRRAHWEKHRKACLHSRVSNLCRQVLSSCKDDMDTLRHLSLLARKGYYSQGRGVVRILFRSPEGAEAFIKNGFQCVGEASYVRWPDLMPSEMGLELYSELLRLSTEYKPDSKMLIYVAICVVSEAPASSGTASVKWERQLVSRCAKLKLSKSVLNEIDYQVQPTVAAQESFTEILILTFNPLKKVCPKDREIVLANIQTLLCRRGVFLRKHYPEIFQRLQNYVEGVTDKIAPVTIHPRDSQTGQGFVCIIMPNSGEMDLSRLPKSDTGNRISTFDVGEDLFES